MVDTHIIRQSEGTDGLAMRELLLLGGPFVCLMLLWVYIVNHPNEFSTLLSWARELF
jgi:hypothetical protein